MQWTIGNLVRAREAVGALLSGLDLETYLFAVEPRGDACEVRVEYPTDEGWKDTVFLVDDASLLDSTTDTGARRRLMDRFSEVLGSARRSTPSRPPEPPERSGDVLRN